ncbi:MAG: cyclic nucleotide-binding domain-containing protein [Rhodospirillaceae bacterium]
MSTGALGRVYEDGEILVRQGDVGDTMFVIQEGDVEIVVERDGRDTVVGMAHAGDMLGELAIFLHERRSATVRAKGQVRALTVDKKNFLRRINEDPSIAFRLVETMSRRVRDLSTELARLKHADAGGPAS